MGSTTEASFFQSSFEYFNSRYDRINDSLEIVLNSERVSDEAHKYVIDYFNLCSEEYMLYKKGYIPTEVWETWLAGMVQYWQIKDVRTLWQEEKETNSYYGFDPEQEFKKLSMTIYQNENLNFLMKSS